MTSHYSLCYIRQTDQASVKGKRDVSLHNLATTVSAQCDVAYSSPMEIHYKKNRAIFNNAQFRC